jgi:hypothetical protein
LALVELSYILTLTHVSEYMPMCRWRRATERPSTR